MSIKKNLKKVNYILIVVVLALQFSPYKFVSYPLYILTMVGFSKTFFEVLDMEDYKGLFTPFSKFLLLLFQLLLMVGLSFIIFKYFKAFKGIL